MAALYLCLNHSVPDTVQCHKAAGKCGHLVIFGLYHYNRKLWNSYHEWEITQRVAGNCPHCDKEIKKMANKTDGDSIQFHKINFCEKYPYGRKRKI